MLVSNVDSQGALEGGILVQVLGEISNNGQESRKFAQTFSLAPQESGFYVYNDIFRFLKEDVESDFGDDQHFEAPNSANPSELSPNGASQSETLFSHGTNVVHPTITPVPQKTAAEVHSETPEAKVALPASMAVAETEKEAEIPALIPAEVVQEIVQSPTQTPVTNEEQAKHTTGTSEAVEAVAKAPAAQPGMSKPAAPMSWAARAAANAKSQVSVTKPATPKPAQAKTVPTTEVEKAVQSPNVSVADVTRSAYLKNISAKMTDEAIRAALKKFGDFKNVEIIRAKACGFVDYLDPTSCAAAIKANKLSVAGEVLLVEERKRDLNGKIGPKEKRNEQYRDNRGEANRGGRTNAGGRTSKTSKNAQPAK